MNDRMDVPMKNWPHFASNTDCLKSVESVYAANSDRAMIELEITGTEVELNLGLSQSAVSRAVNRGVKPVTRQNLQFKK